MGQRHQAFLIARIIPNGRTEAKYRCIAAIHHQWLYGTLPLKAAIRLFRLFRQPENAMIIREEINALHGKHGRRGESFKPELPQIPAPYTMFLMQSAYYTNLDPEDIVASGVCLEDANMGSTEGDNNDGITIIDVTDPEDPHYCFVQFTDYRILSANGYVRGYYPAPSSPESYDSHEDHPQTPGGGIANVEIDHELDRQIADLVAQFSDVKLMKQYMLAEAWPDEYDEQEPSERLPLDKDVEKQPSAPLVLPLVQISLKPALINAMENDRLDALDHYLLDPATRNALRKILMEDSSLQSRTVAVLSKIISIELESDPTATIDLSKFKLTSEEIIAILTPHRDQAVFSLNLSHNPHLTLKTLEHLLTEFMNLRRLVLLDTGVSREDLIALLKSQPSLFYRLSALIHPAFLDQMDRDVAWASDFGHYTPHPYSTSSATLPFFSPAAIVETVISLFMAACLPDAQHKLYYPLSAFFQAAYATEYREEECSWCDRHVPICTQGFANPAIFRLHGWLFIWERPHFPGVNKYGWIRFNSAAVEECEAIRGIEDPVKRGKAAIEALGETLFEVYDLQGFLDACVAEGRPAIPEELKVVALECLERWKTANLKPLIEEEDLGALLMERHGPFLPITSASEVVEICKKQRYE